MQPASADRVLISIDNTPLLQADRVQAQSLSRLDNLPYVEAPTVAVDGGSPGLYKCPSFPRIHGRMTPETRTFSDTTHADSDSISPRVSTDNLTGLDWDKDRLTLGGPVLLTRSVSARTVDSLPPMEPELAGCGASSKPGPQFLSPNMALDGLSSLVSRSTSCPSMATKRSPSASPLSPQSPELANRRMVASADGEPTVDGHAPAPEHQRQCTTRRDKACKSAFMNIGDIPSRHAGGLSSLPQTDRNVKVKCLQWLNSIDQDTDTEGDE